MWPCVAHIGKKDCVYGIFMKQPFEENREGSKEAGD